MIEKETFGLLTDGKEAYKYRLSNNNMTLELTNIGASIVSILVPDKNGKMTDVALGFDTPEDYVVKTGPAFGATVGRNANRIEGATCQIEGEIYHLDQNDGHNNLHSGNDKSYTKIWDVKSIDEAKNEMVFSLVLEDGCQGFPGNFTIDVKYTLTDENEIEIEYQGECDQTTIANFTNHCYFNLDGHNSGDILDHYVKIYAKMYTPFKDDVNIPSGEMAYVYDTPLDFTHFKRIGKEINRPHKQIQIGSGYDHNFVLDTTKKGLIKAAEVFSNKSKIMMDVYTDLEGMQFYTGNFLDGSIKGKENCFYQKRSGFCLETQHHPNAINIEAFKSPILEKGETYYTKTVYQFKIKK